MRVTVVRVTVLRVTVLRVTVVGVILMGKVVVRVTVVGVAGHAAKVLVSPKLPTSSYSRGMSDIKKVGILGSGIMGAGLAEVAARAGYDVVVRSRSQSSADAMVASIDKGFAKAIERGKSTEEERAAVLGRISATDHLGAVADCDLVIESVVEDLAIKKALFAELEQIVKPSGILATNTSTLPVVEMAMVTQRPDKVVGIHFFNPAPMMKLVEVVPVSYTHLTLPTSDLV